MNIRRVELLSAVLPVGGGGDIVGKCAVFILRYGILRDHIERSADHAGGKNAAILRVGAFKFWCGAVADVIDQDAGIPLVDGHHEPAHGVVFSIPRIPQVAHSNQAVALHIELRNGHLPAGFLRDGNLREHLHGTGWAGGDDLDRFAERRHKIKGGTVVLQDIRFLHASGLRIGFPIAGFCLVFRCTVVCRLPGESAVLWNVAHGGRFHGGLHGILWFYEDFISRISGEILKIGFNFRIIL